MATSHRISGFGQRVGEYLSVDVNVGGLSATGIVAFGFLDGSVTCTYKSFTNGHVAGDTGTFRGSGTCTYEQPAFAHVQAHHSFQIILGTGNAADEIDVNSLPNSPAGITLPGGAIEAGGFTLH